MTMTTILLLLLLLLLLLMMNEWCVRFYDTFNKMVMMMIDTGCLPVVWIYLYEVFLLKNVVKRTYNMENMPAISLDKPRNLIYGSRHVNKRTYVSKYPTFHGPLSVKNYKAIIKQNNSISYQSVVMSWPPKQFHNAITGFIYLGLLFSKYLKPKVHSHWFVVCLHILFIEEGTSLLGCYGKG